MNDKIKQLTEKVDITIDKIKRQYAFKDGNLPWLIGYSGGKDSSCTAQLVFRAVKELKAAGELLERKVIIFSSDTMIEVVSFDENLSDIERRKESIDADIKYINEDILPLKLVHKRIVRILDEINAERPYLILKSIEELKKYFSNSAEELLLIERLEKKIPESNIQFQYDISEEEYRILNSVDSLLGNYNKKALLDNIQDKNDYVEKLREKLDILGKKEDSEAQKCLSELDMLRLQLEESKNGLNSLSLELEANDEKLSEAKLNYDGIKQVLTKRKKNSTGYINAMMYKDAVDEFITDNTQRICEILNTKVLEELKLMGFRNNSISSIEISPKSFEMKMYEKDNKIIPSALFSAGEKQVLLGLIIKAALSVSHTDTFFLFDTPVGRLDSKNRKVFTQEVIFDVSDQVFIFATDSDYSEKDYKSIKQQITQELVLERDSNDEIILTPGSIY